MSRRVLVTVWVCFCWITFLFYVLPSSKLNWSFQNIAMHANVLQYFWILEGIQNVKAVHSAALYWGHGWWGDGDIIQKMKTELTGCLAVSDD